MDRFDCAAVLFAARTSKAREPGVLVVLREGLVAIPASRDCQEVRGKRLFEEEFWRDGTRASPFHEGNQSTSTEVYINHSTFDNLHENMFELTNRRIEFFRKIVFFSGML